MARKKSPKSHLITYPRAEGFFYRLTAHPALATMIMLGKAGYLSSQFSLEPQVVYLRMTSFWTFNPKTNETHIRKQDVLAEYLAAYLADSSLKEPLDWYDKLVEHGQAGGLMAHLLGSALVSECVPYNKALLNPIERALLPQKNFLIHLENFTPLDRRVRDGSRSRIARLDPETLLPIFPHRPTDENLKKLYDLAELLDTADDPFHPQVQGIARQPRFADTLDDNFISSRRDILAYRRPHGVWYAVISPKHWRETFAERFPDFRP